MKTIKLITQKEICELFANAFENYEYSDPCCYAACLDVIGKTYEDAEYYYRRYIDDCEAEDLVFWSMYKDGFPCVILGDKLRGLSVAIADCVDNSENGDFDLDYFSDDYIREVDDDEFELYQYFIEKFS